MTAALLHKNADAIASFNLAKAKVDADLDTVKKFVGKAQIAVAENQEVVKSIESLLCNVDSMIVLKSCAHDSTAQMRIILLARVHLPTSVQRWMVSLQQDDTPRLSQMSTCGETGETASACASQAKQYPRRGCIKQSLHFISELFKALKKGNSLRAIQGSQEGQQRRGQTVAAPRRRSVLRVLLVLLLVQVKRG